MTYYDGIDLLWSDDGDLALGRDHDIADTSFDPLLAVAQDLYDRVKCDRGDYRANQLIGASLSDEIGEPNDAVTGMRIQRRILNAMRIGKAINTDDLSIDIFPVGIHQLAIKLQLVVQPTVWNKKSRILGYSFIYMSSENNTYSGGLNYSGA